MNVEQYVTQLESQVDPSFVEDIKDWPTDTKLYMYLHNIQLAHMREYMAIAIQIKDHLGIKV
jgi:hypothetical protein